MKFAIKWYEDSIRNWSDSLDRDSEIIKCEQERLDRDRKFLEFRRAQVAEAKRRGLTEFDCDRFMVPRKKKP